MEFLYQNEVELTEPLALDLYEVAKKYKQIELAKICEEFLSRNLRLDNFVAMIDFVEKSGAGSLKNAILAFMIKNIQEIQEKQRDYKIPKSYLWEVASRVRETFK